MDYVNLVAQLIQNTVILSTAVELGVRWRELAEKVGKLSSAHIADYEAPHRGNNGEIGSQVSFTPKNRSVGISDIVNTNYSFLRFFSQCGSLPMTSCSPGVCVMETTTRT